MFPKNSRSGASLALALLGAACALAPPARADSNTLEPSIQLEQQYNSNIFSRESDKKDSQVTLVRPMLSFRNRNDRGFVYLNGWLSNHTYWQESELNGTDRGGALEFDHAFTQRFGVFGTGNITRFVERDEIRGSDIAVIGEGGEVIAFQPGRIESGGGPNVDIDSAVVGARYAFTQRTSLQIFGGPNRTDYGSAPLGATTFRDRAGWYAGTSLSYALTPLDRVSLDLITSVTDQDDVTAAIFPEALSLAALGAEDRVAFETTPIDLGTGESRSEQQQIKVAWERTWSSAWSTRMAIGVRRLHSEVSDAATQAATAAELCVLVLETCLPVNVLEPTTTFIPTDFDDTGPAVIGELTLRRSFERSWLTLSYSRTTQVNSGATTSDVDVDEVLAQYRHRLAERVSFELTGRFQYLENAGDRPEFRPATFDPVPADPPTPLPWRCDEGTLSVFGSGASSIGQCEIGQTSRGNGQSLTLGARLDWQLRKRLGTYLVIRYYDQMGDPGVLGADYDKYTIGIGFRYAYDLEL